MLTVTDTGCGIKQEHLERIFDPYFTTKQVGRGSGMGLAVVHGIVRSHEGIITVKSSVGQGTTVTVYFPRIEQEVAAQETADTTPLPVGQEHILIVDDEDSIAALTQTCLTMLGYQATAMTDSLEALKLFAADPLAYDLVITDQTMPRMTGEKLAQELLTIRPDLPIILCTGFSAKINEKKATALGIRAYIMKPVTHRVLAQKVRQILDACHRARQ